MSDIEQHVTRILTEHAKGKKKVKTSFRRNLSNAMWIVGATLFTLFCVAAVMVPTFLMFDLVVEATSWLSRH